jgi:chromosome segregation ATPase
LFLSLIGYIAYNFGAGLLSGALSFLGFLGTTIVIAIVLGFIVTQRKLIGTVWNVLMYKLTNWIYKIDPISIAWSRLNSLKEKAEKINKSVERIKGALYNTESQISKNQSEISEKEEEVKALSKLNKQMEMKLIANQIQRLQDWNKQLEPLRDTMLNMQNGLNKLYEAAEFVIKDKESDLTFLEKKYNSVKIGWAAVKAAQGIYGKNSEDRKDLEQLIGLADTDMNNKLAEMDRFMDLAAPVLMQVDIESTINDNKAQDIINRLTGGEIDKVIDNLKNPQTPAQENHKELDAASVSKNTLPDINSSSPIKLHSQSDYNVLD